MNLKDQLIKLGNTYPELRENIAKVLDKVASRNSYVAEIIDLREMGKLRSEIRKTHTDTADLVRDIMNYYQKRFELKPNEATALNHLRNLLSKGNLPAEMKANTIYKIADLLGLL